MITIKKFTKDEILAVLKLPSGDYATDYLSDLKIDRGNLEDEFVQQASHYSWWATLSALAEDDVETEKLSLEVVEAEVDSFLRERALREGVKITEAQISKKIVGNEDWLKAKKKFLETKKKSNILKAVTGAWEHRKFMLVALGGKRKQEYEKDLVIKKRIE